MRKYILPDKIVYFERRKHPRMLVDYVSEVFEECRLLFISVINLSEGGAGIFLPKRFSVGTKIDVKIDYALCESLYDTFERINIPFKAEIIWIKKHGSFYRGGLKIVYIANKDLIRLQSRLKGLQEQEIFQKAFLND